MCPDCRQPLIVFELEGVEVDRCVRCGGSWLDAGEIEMILRLAGVPSEELSAALAAADSAGRGRRRCPRCRRRLHPVKTDRGGGIVIDRCPAGHGIWLDRGEIHSLVEAFAPGADGGGASGGQAAAATAGFFAELLRFEMGGAGPG